MPLVVAAMVMGIFAQFLGKKGLQDHSVSVYLCMCVHTYMDLINLKHSIFLSALATVN